MPTYDYVCDACEHEFELYQGINDPKKRKCPECGKLKLRRLLGTGAAVVFKGSGFYQTDYRSESYKKAQAADKPKESGSSGDAAKGGKDKAPPSKTGGEASSKSSGTSAGSAAKKSKD